MLELEDAKLGKVKVVNVTEARQNIASIMSDRESNYVITKNNKPIRVIVNYETYRKSQEALHKKGRFAEPSKEVLGFLETREAELKSQLESPRQEKPRPVKPQSPPSFNPPPPSMSVEDSAQLSAASETEDFSSYYANPKETPSPSNPQEEKYFSRYQKLYSQKPDRADDEQTPPATTVAELEAEASQTQETETNFSPEPNPYSNLESESEPLPPLEQAPAPPAPRAEPPPQPRVALKKTPAPKPVEKEPPSIEDLLRELENEKLTGE